MFEYDHSLLSLVELHKKGVRSTRELEEVIEGYSFAEEVLLPEIEYKVVRFIGFTKFSKPLKIVCRISSDMKLVTLDAQTPTVEEIINDFCRNCG